MNQPKIQVKNKMGEYKPKTDKDKIQYLMETDERRDRHIKILQTDIKSLDEKITGLTIAIIGSPLNGNKGFVTLMDNIEKKVDLQKAEIEGLKDFKSTLQPQFNIGKYVFLLFVIAIVGSYVREKIETKEKEKTEITR